VGRRPRRERRRSAEVGGPHRGRVGGLGPGARGGRPALSRYDAAVSPVLRREELPRALLDDLTGRPADPSGGPQARAARVDGDTWLDQLPRRVAEALDRWRLVRDESQDLRAGFTALVVPVRRPRGDL